MKKLNLLKFIYQFINYTTLTLAIGLYTLSVYVWSKIDTINSLILILTTIGLFVTLSTIFSICWTGDSPCAFLVSKILYSFKLFIVFVLGLLLLIDQEKFIEFMKDNLDDSNPTIDEVQNDVNRHFKAVTVLYATYVTLMVFFCLCSLLIFS